MDIEPFFHETTSTLTYVVFDPVTRDAIVIDPVLDYDLIASRISTAAIDRVAQFVEKKRLRVRAVIETHAHADHLSASQILHERFGAPVVIGESIVLVQKTFADIFDLPLEFRVDGSQFDKLLHDGEVAWAGSLRYEAVATPGHTPACMSIRVGDAVFTGDALFVEDYGTGRTDFPMGSADALYTSVHDRLYSLPDSTRVLVGHDYQPGGRTLRYDTTIGVSKRSNVQLRAETSREEFVRFRTARDATLAPPKLLWASVQTNIDAGNLPPPHANGRRYFRIPISEPAPAVRSRDVAPRVTEPSPRRMLPRC